MSDSTQIKHCLTGVVVGVRSAKTARVRIERRVPHKKYGKLMRRTKTYLVHDEQSTCRPGDIITFRMSRPHSKTKHWELVGVVTRSAS